MHHRQVPARGRSVKVTMGPHGPVTPAAARAKAVEIVTLAKTGRDVARRTPRSRGSATMADLAQRFMGEYAPAHLKPSTAALYRPGVFRRRVGSGTREARRTWRRRVVRSRSQPDRFRPALPGSSKARPAAAGPAGRGYVTSQPLTFPRNPHHHLVRHYQDGGLKRGRINDPELDSRLALELFGDQWRALRRAAHNLLTAWHWLSMSEFEAADSALDELFSALRDARR